MHHPAQCQNKVLQEIDREVRRLERHKKARTSIEVERTHLETRRSPDGLTGEMKRERAERS